MRLWAIPRRLEHDEIIRRIRPLAPWRNGPIVFCRLNIEVFDEREFGSLPLGDVVMDVPVKEPGDVLKELLLHFRSVWEVPLSGGRKEIGGTHQTAVCHVASCGLIQEEKLPDLLKPRHLSVRDVVLDELLLPLRHMPWEEVLDAVWRSVVVLHEPLELCREVPMLKHVVNDVCGNLTQAVEVQARVAFPLPVSFAGALSLRQELPVPVGQLLTAAFQHLVVHLI
mmetsp:Transcript_38736/g.92543  ORF Transcript_38736/g.92543 Transcript_38736/m.92543 type:complete len:225 (-) Transcript_38736:329-1003(-)